MVDRYMILNANYCLVMIHNSFHSGYQTVHQIGVVNNAVYAIEHNDLNTELRWLSVKANVPSNCNILSVIWK